MTLEELRAKVREWDATNTGGSVATAHYLTILNELDYHATREWRVYLPAQHPDCNASYMERLASWIGNLSDEKDQKLFLEYALRISFFSHDDFVALYRTALDREVTRWIAGRLGLSFQSGIQAFQDAVHKQIHQHTWFCPVTDSMDINEFYKANHLQGVGQRPCFSSLQMLSEHPTNPNHQIASDWIRYMTNPHPRPDLYRYPPLEQIVLLEDIVGSGSQCIKSLRWAAASLGKPVLFIPLIICPNGAKELRALEQQLGGQLTVRPVIELCRGDLMGDERQGAQTWNGTLEMEALARRCNTASPFNYPVFGYNNTGCSLATFANTPDNSLPIIHDKAQSGAWRPLFPRVYRDS